MRNLKKPIHLAGVQSGRHRHVCAFLDDQDQEDKRDNPFLKEGIDRGERAFCISTLKKMKRRLCKNCVTREPKSEIAEKRDQ